MSLISIDETMTCRNDYILKKDTASLFPQTDYFQFEFPPPQYLGAKYLMR